MGEPWGPGYPGPPAPGPWPGPPHASYPPPGYPPLGHPHPSYGYAPPVPSPERAGKRCAVLAPVLLVASAVLLVLAPFLLIVGVFSAGSSEGGLGFALVVGLVFFVLAGGLWVGSVVCSILGLARARGGYRWSAGVTLALAVGTIPLLSVLDTISDLT